MTVTLETLRADFEAARHALVEVMTTPGIMWQGPERPIGPGRPNRPGNLYPFDSDQIARLMDAGPDDIWQIPQAVMFDHSEWANLKSAARKLSNGAIDPRVQP